MRDNNNSDSLEPQQVGTIVMGLMAGQFVVPDDFDDPLDDELLDLFEGKDDVKLTDKGS